MKISDNVRYLRRIPAHDRGFGKLSERWGDWARVIGSNEKIILSAKDWEVFYEALINPPEPNNKLKEAAPRYRERAGG